MTYSELKEYMDDFHMGKITKLEMAATVGLYQRQNTGGIPETKACMRKLFRPEISIHGEWVRRRV